MSANPTHLDLALIPTGLQLQVSQVRYVPSRGDSEGWKHVAMLATILTANGETVFKAEYRSGVACLHKEAQGNTMHAEGLATRLYGFKEPTLADVMHCLLMDGSTYFDNTDFEDWCAECGYSTDSIKAEETWEECRKAGKALSFFINKEQLTKLREAAQDY